VYDLCRIYQLRKPKTNIQILQQNVLLKQKYLVTFLRQHGPEVFQEIRSAYVDTLSRVLSAHFRSYLAALERLQVRPLLVVLHCSSAHCLQKCQPHKDDSNVANVEGEYIHCQLFVACVD